jgi:ElaB/YqjD/DUF883 family membrane-anchored ribosome-binding protein
MDENETKAQEIEARIQEVNKEISTLKESMKQVKKLKERQPMNEQLKQLRTKKELLIREQAEYCKRVQEKVIEELSNLLQKTDQTDEDELKKLARMVAHETS